MLCTTYPFGCYTNPENKSHWVRDVTFDEDRSQVRCGNMPPMMAALRNTAIGLLRWAGHTNIAAACRRLAAQPAKHWLSSVLNSKTEWPCKAGLKA